MLRDGILYRKFYGHTVIVLHHQLVVPKQLRAELLYRIHNSKFGGHLGIQATISEFRKRFYFPNFSEVLLEYIRNCSCLQLKPAKKNTITSLLQPLASEQCFPGEMLQVDIVGKMYPSGGYTHILTTTDVFSRYLFSSPLRNAETEQVARAHFKLFMHRSYLPSKILYDLGTAMMRQLCALLEIQLQYATMKHPQTIGVLERSHFSKEF